MAARLGMSELITELRTLTAAGTADYSLAGSVYFSDEYLQGVLDKNRVDFRREALMTEPTYDNGTTRYYDFYFKRRNVEGTASGTPAWRVENAAGSVVAAGTALYSVNMDAGVITFVADQGGTPYYLSGREYDLNRAAAVIWDKKAADVWDAFDLKTDNHDMTRSQKYKHATDQAAKYRAMAKPRVSRLVRSDVN